MVMKYRVRSGDTLSAIARKHNTTIAALKLANWIADEDRIIVGQVLDIEPTSPSQQQVTPFRMRNGASATPFTAKESHKATSVVSRDAPPLKDVLSGSTFLELGMRGPAVRELQRLLVLTGHLAQHKVNTGPGMFGLATIAGVKSFQKTFQVEPIVGRPLGTVGRATLDALYRATPPHVVATGSLRPQASNAANRGPAGKITADAVASQRADGTGESDSVFEVVWDWLWGTLQGDFNRDPTLSQLAVNTVLGLIPLVDQALDLRDIVAGLKDLIEYYMEEDAEQEKHSRVLGLEHELWLWINVFIIAIGCIPEVGSLAKGMLRAIVEAVQKVGRRADPQLWQSLLPVLKRLQIDESSARNALRELATQSGDWMATASTRIGSSLRTIQNLLTSAENVVFSKATRLLPAQTVKQLQESIRKISKALRRVYDRLDEMKAEVNRRLREHIDRLISQSTVKASPVSGSTKSLDHKMGLQIPSSGSKRPSDPPPPKKPSASRKTIDSLDALYGQLTEKARKSFDQQRQLHSHERFSQMEVAYKNATDGEYDVLKANAFFEKKHLSDADFQARLKVLKESFHAKSKEISGRLKNVVNETNGVNRPNASLGNGSTEAALDQELLDGAPWKCGDGHHGKIATAIKTLQLGIDDLQRLREHITDPKALSEVDEMIQSATARIAAMRPALDRWNQRARTHPKTWNPDGTSKNKPGWP